MLKEIKPRPIEPIWLIHFLQHPATKCPIPTEQGARIQSVLSRCWFVQGILADR